MLSITTMFRYFQRKKSAVSNHADTLSRKCVYSVLIILSTMMISGCSALSVPLSYHMSRIAHRDKVFSHTPIHVPTLKTIRDEEFVYDEEEGFRILLQDFSRPAVRLDIFEDPMCPYCGRFEQSPLGQKIYEYISAGKIEAHYHFVNFLDRFSSSKEYSSKIIGVMATLYQANISPKTWLRVHKKIFDASFQPEENSSTEPTIQDIAKIVTDTAEQEKVTISPQLRKALTHNHAAQGRAIAAKALHIVKKKHIEGVPTVLVDKHKKKTALTLEQLEKLVGRR